MNGFLAAGGALNLIIALLHVAIIFGGSGWYRFFNAPDRMAKLAEQGSILPTLSTSGITLVFLLWALYDFSGSGLIRRLPLLKTALVGITCIYLLRGLLIFPALFLKPEIINAVILWSSIFCLAIGFLHAMGVYRVWSRI